MRVAEAGRRVREEGEGRGLRKEDEGGVRWGGRVKEESSVVG